MEAVKQGSVCLGLKSRTHAVLCSLKRLPSELAGYQEKLFKVDDYIGMAMSGLTADARVLCKFMRNECLNYKMTFGANKSLKRLLEKVAESMKCSTARVAGQDTTGQQTTLWGGVADCWVG
jgi:20S proteasome subunit alpha 6